MGYDRGVDLEEHSIETVGERCQECGVKLTAEELQDALERGGAPMCTVHAAEAEPTEAEDELEEL